MAIITGFGLTGFGMTVMLFSVLVERWGYKVMLAATFAFHLLSGAITLLATPLFHSFGKDAAFWSLSLGTTIFSVGNGAAEAVVNPLDRRPLSVRADASPEHVARGVSGRIGPGGAGRRDPGGKSLGTHPADVPGADVDLWRPVFRPAAPRVAGEDLPGEHRVDGQ